METREKALQQAPKKATLFKTGGSQAVRIPAQFRLSDDDSIETYVVRDVEDGSLKIYQEPRMTHEGLVEMLMANCKAGGIDIPFPLIDDEPQQPEDIF